MTARNPRVTFRRMRRPRTRRRSPTPSASRRTRATSSSRRSSTKLEGARFEHFVAHLLEAMDYRTQVTPASGDGGFDIIAHRDPLGLEPPIIKVQCKRTLG